MHADEIGTPRGLELRGENADRNGGSVGHDQAGRSEDRGQLLQNRTLNLQILEHRLGNDLAIAEVIKVRRGLDAIEDISECIARSSPTFLKQSGKARHRILE